MRLVQVLWWGGGGGGASDSYRGLKAVLVLHRVFSLLSTTGITPPPQLRESSCKIIVVIGNELQPCSVTSWQWRRYGRTFVIVAWEQPAEHRTILSEEGSGSIKDGQVRPYHFQPKFNCPNLTITEHAYKIERYSRKLMCRSRYNQRYRAAHIVQPEIRLCSQDIEHVDIRKSVSAAENCGTNEPIQLACIAVSERELIKAKEICAKRAESARATCVKRG